MFAARLASKSVSLGAARAARSLSFRPLFQGSPSLLSRGDSSGSSWRRANSDRTPSKSFLDKWGLGGNNNNNHNYNDNRNNNGRGPFQWFRDMIEWLEEFFLYRVPSFMQAPLAIHALLWPNILVFGAWKWVEAGRDRGAILRMYHNFSIYGNSPMHTLLTAAFSHQNGFHLLFNMFTLWNFGPAVLASIGAAELLAFYCATAVISNIVQRELNPRAVSLGASGAVYGLMSAFALTHPTAPMYLFMIPIAIPAYVCIGGLMALDFYQLGSPTAIGHAAHLSGAACGALMWALRIRGRRW